MVIQIDIHSAEARILQIVVAIFHALSISLACFRLSYRTWKSQLWWEDCWAGVALVAETISMITVWFLANPVGRIIAYWHLMIAFTICLWSARLSVVCSIIRLVPHGWNLRKMAIIAAVSFCGMLLWLLIEKIYFCAHDTWWYALEPITCRLGTAIAVSQLATDAISDIILVALPSQLVRQSNVPRDQRIIILSVFSSGTLISLISVVHFVFMSKPDPYFKMITGQIEIALSVIVCNLLVIVTCIYKLFRRDVFEGASMIASRPVCFTTIFDATGQPESRVTPANPLQTLSRHIAP